MAQGRVPGKCNLPLRMQTTSTPHPTSSSNGQLVDVAQAAAELMGEATATLCTAYRADVTAWAAG